mgnify:CR=1 FL=1
MTNDDQLRRARQLAASGDRHGAAAIWSDVLARQPDNTEGLNFLGNWELANGRAAQAESHFRKALAIDPGQPALLFNHAASARAAGMLAAAERSLTEALAVDPYFVQAMFQLAVLYEDTGEPRKAAQVYRNFVDTAPPELMQDARYQGLIARAKKAIEDDNRELGNAILSDAGTPTRRMTEMLGSFLGQHRSYVSEPTFLSVPRLPAIPFLEREATPWLSILEDAAPAITRELRSLLDETAQPDFVPYVNNPPGVPANQWKELDHSSDWSAYFFWKHGQRHEAHCTRCPVTAEVLEALPMPRLANRAPNAFFSLLKPGVRIPPHTGVTNARLTCHLALVVPQGCGFRVGPETRQWQEGKAWVFDDTIEHEAWNEGTEPRYILIVDVWHPMLEPAEQDFVATLLDRYDVHYGSRRASADGF